MAGAIMVMPNPFSAGTDDIKNLYPSLIVENTKAKMDANLRFLHSYGEFAEPVPEVIPELTRRPLTGIEVKPNTRARVAINRVSDGRAVFVFNELGSTQPVNSPALDFTQLGLGDLVNQVNTNESAADLAAPQNKVWTDFFLTRVAETREEKFQLMETFGKPIMYVFGEKPQFISFKGYLMNTNDFNWKAEFWHNWDNFFRATKLVTRGHIMSVLFDDVVVRGYPINAMCQQTADSPNICVFSFNFYVVHYTNLYLEGNIPKLHKLRLPAHTWNRTPPPLPVHTNWSATRGIEYLPEGRYDGGTIKQPLIVRDQTTGMLLYGNSMVPVTNPLTGAHNDPPDGTAMVDMTQVKWNTSFSTDTSLALRWQEETLGHGNFSFFGGGRTFAGLMYDLTPQGIKGGLTAMTALTNDIVSSVRKAAGRHMISTGQEKSGFNAWKGGRRHQDFIFGSIAHFFRFAFRNMVATGAGLSEEFAEAGGKGGRWGALGQALLLSGNSNALPDYMGYGINATLGTAILEGTAPSGSGKTIPELSGSRVDWSTGGGLVRDQPKFGFAELSGGETVATAIFGSAQKTFSGEPGGSQTIGFGSLTSALEKEERHVTPATLPEEGSSTEKAAVAKQNEETESGSDGALQVALSGDEEINDDGGEEEATFETPSSEQEEGEETGGFETPSSEQAELG